MNIFKHWRELADVHETNVIAPNTFELVTATGKYILKIKTNERELSKAVHLLYALDKVGVPVERTVQTIYGDPYIAENGQLYCLFIRLNGRTIDDEFDRVNCCIFGEAIARLHGGLDRASIGDLHLREMRFHENIEALIAIRNGDSNELHAEYLRKKTRKLDELPKVPIHRDTHPRNIIFEDRTLSGFIDLELSTNGPRIFDAVYCSTAILSNMYETQKEQWPMKLKELIDGYLSVCALNESEKHYLLPMAIYIQQLFAWFYEKHDNDAMARHNFEIGQWLFSSKDRIAKIVGLVGA